MTEDQIVNLYENPGNSQKSSGHGPAIGSPAIQVLGIEIVQVVQDMMHSVPLVAGKATVVRVYLDASDIATLTQVSGEIEVRGGSVNGPARYVASTGTVTLDPSIPIAIEHLRSDASKSLNFWLPSEVLKVGDIAVRLGKLRTLTGSSLTVSPHPERAVSLGTAPKLRIKIIGYRYRDTKTGKTHSPAAVHFDYLQSFIRRTLPIADLSWQQIVVDADFSAPFKPNTPRLANAQTAALRASDIGAGADPGLRYLAITADTDGNFLRGLASGIPQIADPSFVAVAPVGPGTSFEGDEDQSYADWYGTHELSHTFGRFHPGFPPPTDDGGQDASDLDFPYADGCISNNTPGFVGFDVGDPSLAVRPQALPGRVYHDVMTYKPRQWLSNHTYSAILKRLLEENDLFPPPDLTGAGGQMWEAGMATTAGGAILSDDQRHVHIVALVDLAATTGDIRYVMPAVAPIELPTTDTTSGYPGLAQVWLVQRDVEGNELDREAVELRMDACTSPGETGDGLVQQTLALAGATATIELLIGDAVVDSYSAGASLAMGMKTTMMAAEVAEGQPHRRLIDLEGIEPEEGVSYTVQARPVGEPEWSTLSVGRPTPTVSLDRNQFGLTPAVDVRVLRNQGFSQRLVAAEQIALNWDAPLEDGE